MRLVQRMKKQPRHWYMVKREGVEGGLVSYQKKEVVVGKCGNGG